MSQDHLKCSHDANLVGNVEGVQVTGELDVGLLLALGRDQSVNFLDLDSVQLLNGLFDLVLV